MSLPPYRAGVARAWLQRDNVVSVGLALAISAGLSLGLTLALAWSFVF